MNQRALNEMRHRTGIDGWMFYLWAIPCTAGAVFLTWLTFRNGILFLIGDPKPFMIWLISLMALASLWRARPHKKKSDQDTRLNLQ